MTEASIMRLALRLAAASWLMIALALAFIAANSDESRAVDAGPAASAGTPLPAHASAAPAMSDAAPSQSETRPNGRM